MASLFGLRRGRRRVASTAEATTNGRVLTRRCSAPPTQKAMVWTPRIRGEMHPSRVDVGHTSGWAKLLASQNRLRIVVALLRGPTTVSGLAADLELELDAVSWHLRELRRAHLVTARRWGRLSSYEIDARRIKPVLAALHRLPRRRGGRSGHVRSMSSLRQPIPDLRQARTCYDHLAGGAGVYLLRELIQRTWLVPSQNGGRAQYALSGRGMRALTSRGVKVLRAHRTRRALAYGCADWSESHRHLGGALGAEILAALLRAGILQRVGRSRRLVWQRPIASWLGGAGRGGLLAAGRARSQ